MMVAVNSISLVYVALMAALEAVSPFKRRHKETQGSARSSRFSQTMSRLTQTRGSTAPYRSHSQTMCSRDRTVILRQVKYGGGDTKPMSQQEGITPEE